MLRQLCTSLPRYGPCFQQHYGVYDGTWLTRGHTSHIGVGTVIEFYTGLVLNCAVLSNRCHGCTLGPKEGDESYDSWKASHICQKNTDVKSGRMEVEAALILFRQSLEKHGFCCTLFVTATAGPTWHCAKMRPKGLSDLRRKTVSIM